MLDSLADSSARLERLLELATKEKDPMKSDEIAADIRRVLDEREVLRNRRNHQTTQTGKLMRAELSPNAEALEKLSEAMWIQYRHESEKRIWPMWKRLIHRLLRCPICRPEGGTRLDC